MKKILLTILMSFMLTSLFAQQTDSVSKGFRLKENRVYPITINNSNESFLTAINDSSLQLSPYNKKYGSPNGKIVTYTQINDFSIKRSSTGRSILIGVITGIVVGVIIGAATYSKPTPGQSRGYQIDLGIGANIAGGSILGGLGGLAVGAVMGSAKKKFKISGSKERFQSMYKSLTN